MSELKAFSLDDLDPFQLTQENTEMQVDVNFPFSPEFPATTGLELEGGHNVVYFEIDPGKKLGTHTDSPEELIICLQGKTSRPTPATRPARSVPVTSRSSRRWRPTGSTTAATSGRSSSGFSPTVPIFRSSRRNSSR